MLGNSRTCRPSRSGSRRRHGAPSILRQSSRLTSACVSTPQPAWPTAHHGGRCVSICRSAGASALKSAHLVRVRARVRVVRCAQRDVGRVEHVRDAAEQGRYARVVEPVGLGVVGVECRAEGRTDLAHLQHTSPRRPRHVPHLGDQQSLLIVVSHAAPKEEVGGR
eukprot:scaffold124602_cov66-Phaeocystis_antarctica.AAC.1